MKSGYSVETYFQTTFKLPFAGIRNLSDAVLSNQGSYANYWSSSPSMMVDYLNYARYLYMGASGVFATSIKFRASGNSVRCFKNSTEAKATRTVTFNANGGELSGADLAGTLVQKVEDGKKAQSPVSQPTKSGYGFG